MGLLGSYGLILPHDHPCYCYELVTSHRRQTQCKNADSDTGKKKKEEKFLEFIWRGMTPSTWRCHGWEKELHPRGVRFSPWLCGGRRCCFGSPCGSWSIGIRGCGDVFFHLQAAVWGQDTSHVYAWPVVILVRRLCCGVDRFSCLSMSPTPEVFLEVFLSHTAVTCVLKLQTLVYDILPSTTAIFSYAIGSRKLSANEQFFVGAQTVVNLLQTAQIISDVCFITDHVAYASSNQTKIILIKTVLFFFTRGGCTSCLCACLGTRLLPQSYQYPKLLEGAECIGGQLCGDKEYPFSDVTKSGRVWRKVSESGARSVMRTQWWVGSVPCR